MDIKPWDDETDMKKLEEAVRSIEMPGLFWGACMVLLLLLLDLASRHYLQLLMLQGDPILLYT